MPESLPPAKDSKDMTMRPSDEIGTKFKIRTGTAPLKV